MAYVDIGVQPFTADFRCVRTTSFVTTFTRLTSVAFSLNSILLSNFFLELLELREILSVPIDSVLDKDEQD